jgi:hypothetical protein
MLVSDYDIIKTSLKFMEVISVYYEGKYFSRTLCVCFKNIKPDYKDIRLANSDDGTAKLYIYDGRKTIKSVKRLIEKIKNEKLLDN